MQRGYYLKVSKCPLEAWEDRFTEGDKAIRKHHKTTRLGKLVLWVFKGIRYKDRNDYEAWCVLFDDFRDKIGLDEDFEEYINNMYALQEAQTAFILSQVTRDKVEVRDRRHLNLVNKLKAKIRVFEESQSGKNNTVTQVLISLYRGEKLQLLDKRNLTVEQYFTLIRSFNKKAA